MLGSYYQYILELSTDNNYKKSLTYASFSSREETVAYATDKTRKAVNIIINSFVNRTGTHKEFQLI